MKGDLQSLRRETESGLTKSGMRRPALPYRMATTTFQTSSKFSTYLLLGVSAVLLTVLIAMGRGGSNSGRWRTRARQEHDCRAAAAEHEW